MTPRRPTERSRRAEIALFAAAFLPLLALDSPADLEHSVRVRGAVLWLACLLPAFSYLLRKSARREPVPFFPLFGVIFGIYFALPAVLGTVNLAYVPNQMQITWLDPVHDFDMAIDLALYGWLALLFGYAAMTLFAPSRRRQQAPFPTAGLGPMLLQVALAGMGLDIISNTINVPGVVRGVVVFAATLSQFALAALLALSIRGQLTKRQRSILLVAIPVEVVILLASGSIAKVFLFGFLLLVSYWIVGGGIPLRWLFAGLAAAALLITLKGVLQDYRRLAWFSGVTLSITDRTALMADLVQARVAEKGPVGALTMGADAAAGRSAILDMLADVTRRTPRDIPYWGGVTYLSLVGVAIPRVLWPGKPQKRLGQDFGHRYTYIDPRDMATSVNLPFLVEFYLNFGPIGVYLGMLLTGAFLRVVDYALNRPGQDIMQSLASAAILLPLLNVESDFSLIFGGVFLNAVAMRIVLRYLRDRGRAKMKAAARSRREIAEASTRHSVANVR